MTVAFGVFPSDLSVFAMPKNYLAAAAGQASLQPAPGIIDDFGGRNGMSRLGTPWRIVTDRVMGGISQASMSIGEHAGRQALCLRGDVSLANNGGFVQANLPLSVRGSFDAHPFQGITFFARGNGEQYNIHLKTADTLAPWQSYRASFTADAQWRRVTLDFTDFKPHRLTAPLDVRRLSKIGVVAIGRAFAAEVCIAELTFCCAKPVR